MSRPNSNAGPTGSNRIDLSAAHLVRYWRGELGCSEDELRAAIAAVGTRAKNVRRYLARSRRPAPSAPDAQQGARP
jgi:hypothetical protein